MGSIGVVGTEIWKNGWKKWWLEIAQTKTTGHILDTKWKKTEVTCWGAINISTSEINQRVPRYTEKVNQGVQKNTGEKDTKPKRMWI